MIAGPLFLLTFAPIEYGRLIWTREALEMTATDAARCVGLRAQACATAGAYDQAKTVAYITNAARNWGLALSSSNISVTTNSSAAGCAGLSAVEITYTYHVVIPAALPVAGNSTQLTSLACYPNET